MQPTTEAGPESADLVVHVGVGDEDLADALTRGGPVLVIESDAARAETLAGAARADGVEDRVELHGPDLTDPPGDHAAEQGRTVDDAVGGRPVRLLRVRTPQDGAAVLLGARQTLRRSGPPVLIDCPDHASFLAVAAVLRPLGYRLAGLEGEAPTVTFASSTPSRDASSPVPPAEAGADAVLARLYAERRRVAELEALRRRDQEDFRVLRTFVEQAEEAMWRAGSFPATEDGGQIPTSSFDERLARLARERDAAAEQADEARSALRRVRSSRTYRAGRTLGELRTRSGLRRALPTLVSLLREGRRGGAA